MNLKIYALPIFDVYSFRGSKKSALFEKGKGESAGDHGDPFEVNGLLTAETEERHDAKYFDPGSSFFPFTMAKSFFPQALGKSGRLRVKGSINPSRTDGRGEPKLLGP
jgi:hypothetical protein